MNTYESTHLIGSELLSLLGIVIPRVTFLTLHIAPTDGLSYAVVHYLEDTADDSPSPFPIDVTTLNSSDGFTEHSLRKCVEKTQRFNIRVSDRKRLIELFGLEDQRVIAMLFHFKVSDFPRVSLRMQVSREQCLGLGEIVKVVNDA